MTLHFTIGWVIHITGPACGFEKRAALKTLAKGSKGHHKVEGGKEEGGGTIKGNGPRPRKTYCDHYWP